LLSQVSSLAWHVFAQVHQELAVAHVVTTLSQVMETPATLLQVVAVQLKKALVHDVLHIADASADDINPGDAASVSTAKRPLRIRSFRILFLLFLDRQTVT
jgi:hypothetical protein